MVDGIRSPFVHVDVREASDHERRLSKREEIENRTDAYPDIRSSSSESLNS